MRGSYVQEACERLEAQAHSVLEEGANYESCIAIASITIRLLKRLELRTKQNVKTSTSLVLDKRPHVPRSMADICTNVLLLRSMIYQRKGRLDLAIRDCRRAGASASLTKAIRCRQKACQAAEGAQVEVTRVTLSIEKSLKGLEIESTAAVGENLAELYLQRG